MENRHQLALSTHESRPTPGQREIYWPSAKLNHLHRAGQPGVKQTD